MNILVTLPAGIIFIIIAFLVLRKIFSLSTLLTGSILALLVIALVSLYSIMHWPGADVFAIHLSLYLMAIYAMTIVFKAREDNISGGAKRFHWAPAAIIGFFVIVIITNTFFILLAQSDGSVSWIKWIVPEPISGGDTKSVFPGTVSHDFRERENQFNEYQQQRAIQTARGWHVKSGWKEKPFHNKPSRFLLQVLDATGQPITNAIIEGKFLYAADFRQDQVFTMQSVGDGMYDTDVILNKPGNWNLVLVITREKDTHELRASTTIN